MKRFVISILSALFLLVILGGIAYYLELVHFEVSPHNTYRLTAYEQAIIDRAVQKFRVRVSEGRFDEIGLDLSKGRRDAYWENIILTDIKADVVEFGHPISGELFRCAQPQVDRDETIYHLDYLTSFAGGERYESVILSKNSNDEINLVNADVGLVEMTEWRIAERDRHRELSRKFPREIIIPFADRYLEVRY